eukprot:COSAG02_NODE_32371_length_517_cov_1.114833_1_plen_31_part_01
MYTVPVRLKYGEITQKSIGSATAAVFRALLK